MSSGNEGLEGRRNAGGGGSRGYAGYEYQIDVSVWLTLHLVAALRVARAVEIEPATQEDLETDVDNDDAPGRLTSGAVLESHRLVVQAKLRSGDAWTESGLRKLLEHGGPRRRSAVDRLQNCEARYLLVTSAGLNGPAGMLEIGDPVGGWPDELPLSIDGLGEVSMRGRVAVAARLDEEKLTSKVKELLTDSFRVPHTQWQACRESLRNCVRARMRGEWGGTWQREEVEGVVREHEGYFASSPELEDFVAPTNWQQLKRTLKTDRGVVIIGQSGTGKTLAAKKLVEELRGEIPGLKHVPITSGARQLHGDRTGPPVVYEIEDPWGRVAFEPDSRDWNQQLPSFLERRLKGAVYVVATSRADVLASAGDARSRVGRWVVALEAEHYGDAERTAIFGGMAAGLPRRLHLTAERAKHEVLSKLATPFEIRKFFDALQMGNPEDPSPGLIRDAIEQAQEDAIEINVADQIEQRGEVRAGAVVWGLLKVAGAVPQAVVTVVEEAFLGRYGEMERGVMSLVRFLVAGRSLRQQADSDGVSYYHPRVEAGIERALLRDGNGLVSKQTLVRLAAFLASDDAPDEMWATAAAAKLVAATRKVEGLEATPDDATAAAIDAWLVARSAATDRGFQEHLELAAGAGSGKSALGEIGRYLVGWQDCTRLWGFIPKTSPPERDDAWYARWRADLGTRPIVERYIRDVLPSDHTCAFDRSFVDSVQRLAPDLSRAFLAAAKRVVGLGVYHPAAIIAAGAVRDRAGFEEVVDEAVAILASAESFEEREAVGLAIANGEYNEDYAEHLAGDCDDGFTAEQFLEAYVRQVRGNGDWRVLADHRHRRHLVGYWLRGLMDSRGASSDPMEVAGVFSTGLDSAEEDRLWYVVERAWQPGFRRPLEERVYEGHEKAETRRAALGCLIERAPDRFPALLRRLRADGRFGRLVEIADDIADWMNSRLRPDFLRHDDAARDAREQLPADVAGIAEACLALRKGRTPAMSKDALKLLESVAEPSSEVRCLRVSMDAHVPMSVNEDVRWLLAHAEDPEAAVKAVDAAIRRRIDDDVWLALRHKYADVVAAALKALGEASAVPLPEQLLAHAEAKGSPIRKVLAAVLDARPHADHLPALLVLLRDEWSKFSGGYRNDGNFPIARAAMSAIHKLAPLGSVAMKEVYRIAVATSDVRVRVDGLRLFARSPEPRFRAHLLDLALRRGRPHMRMAAVDALRAEVESLDEGLLDRITVETLTGQPALIAAGLACLVGAAAAPKTVFELGEALAADPNRRVLALLLIFFVNMRSASVGRGLAALLPADHPGVAWALGEGGANEFDEAALEDLGDAAVCEAVWERVAASLGTRVASAP